MNIGFIAEKNVKKIQNQKNRKKNKNKNRIGVGIEGEDMGIMIEIMIGIKDMVDIVDMVDMDIKNRNSALLIIIY